MRTRIGHLLGGLLVLASSVAAIPAAVAAQPDRPVDRPAPSRASEAIRLPDAAHGERALALLGDQLGAVARSNQMTGIELRHLLLEDRTAWLDEGGRVFFKDALPAAAPTSTAREPAAAPYPLDRTFDLHSKPGSRRTIFLDFDGATVRDTAWNFQTGLASGQHPAWTLDGDATTFVGGERAAIQSIWQRVAEDYAPFDVDVTTQDPGVDALTRDGSTDLVYGTRALVSPSIRAAAAICGSQCGGAAYLNVFGDASQHAAYQPAWVFPQLLGHDVKSIAEAVSHEVGHNFGLEHDGTGSEHYYAGHDTWAPIMGSGYDSPITQWSKGDYAGANNQQDDLAVIAANGAPLRHDEAGGQLITAAPGLPAGAAFLTSDADRDVYALGTCSGPVTLEASPAATSPNLDLSLTLTRADGTVVAAANPLSAAGSPAWDVATGMGATLSSTVASGGYYASVTGVGRGTPSTRYDGYGSVGAYTMRLVGSCDQTVVLPSAPRDFVATPTSDGRSVTLAWTPPAQPGSSPVTSYVVTRSGAPSVDVAIPGHTFSGLTPGAAYTFTVAASTQAGIGLTATTSTAPVVTKPGRVRIGKALGGSRGGSITATAQWRPPVSIGGAELTGYQVFAYQLSSSGRVIRTGKTGVLRATARSVSLTLPARGTWRFAVRAANSRGYGALSPVSNTVRAR